MIAKTFETLTLELILKAPDISHPKHTEFHLEAAWGLHISSPARRLYLQCSTFPAQCATFYCTASPSGTRDHVLDFGLIPLEMGSSALFLGFMNHASMPDLAPRFP